MTSRIWFFCFPPLLGSGYWYQNTVIIYYIVRVTFGLLLQALIMHCYTLVRFHCSETGPTRHCISPQDLELQVFLLQQSVIQLLS